MIICSNCEFAFATVKCEQCANASSSAFFCHQCSHLHLKVKECQYHIFQKSDQQNYLCSNCEASTAKFHCLDCTSSEEQNYCLGCSIIHPKVKVTRNHRVIQNNLIDSTTGLPNLSLRQRKNIFFSNLRSITPICEFIEVLNFYDFPPENLFIPLVLVGAALLLIFFFARNVIGKTGSSIATVIGAIAFLRFAQDRQNKSHTS